MSSAARCLRPVADPSAVNDPPMYKVSPSGDTSNARTLAFVEPVTAGAQSNGLPVAPSSTARFVRVNDDASPAAVPGARTAEKSPPTKTFPPAAAAAHTIPSVCHVDNPAPVNATPDCNAADAGAAARGKTLIPSARPVIAAASRRAIS